jgi:hypothetical protein
MGNLVIFAILPLILLGGLLARLVASGVLTLKPSSDRVACWTPFSWGLPVW